MASSFLKELANFSNPAPELHTEQDELESDVTRARVFAENDDDKFIAPEDPSVLRRLNAPDLGDFDKKYKGEVTRRSEIFEEPIVTNDDDDGESVSDSGSEIFEEKQDNDEDEIEKDQHSTVKLVSSDLQSDHDSQVQKGKAIQSQMKLWDGLLSLRIKIHPLLNVMNQLPRSAINSISWQTFVDDSDEITGKNILTCKRNLTKLLNELLETRELLVASTKRTENGERGSEDDEILSFSDESETEKRDKSAKMQKRKRKLTKKPIPDILEKRHAVYREYRNDVLQKWYEKTRLASGKTNNKRSFAGFETNILTQIEQILSDKRRLVTRSQTNRLDHVRLGKETTLDDGSSDTISQQSIDTEIYDDNDFYQLLLKELIERKSTSTNDPISLSRQWLEIQKLRNKKKKQHADTKASKGRKVRYDIQKKLVNFMAPHDFCQWTEQSREELFSSLFN